MLTILGRPRTHCRLPPRINSLHIACLGDSITRGNASFGSGTFGPQNWHSPVGCWPDELLQLGQRAGWAGIEVANLGFWGSSVMTRLHTPMTEHSASAYIDILQDGIMPSFAAADALFVMLGSNDAKSTMQEVSDHFEKVVTVPPSRDSFPPLGGFLSHMVCHVCCHRTL